MKNKDNLSEYSDSVSVDVASEAIDEEFFNGLLDVPVTTTSNQPQKARVQILEELNGKILFSIDLMIKLKLSYVDYLFII